MRYFVIDTNVLMQIAPKFAEFRYIWDDFIDNKIAFCVSTEIINEYHEKLTQHGSEKYADLVIETILNLKHTKRVETYYRFGLITADVDDNKFVDCAIAGNAELIVTDDNHFKDLEKIPFPKVIAMKLEQFAAYYKKAKGKA